MRVPALELFPFLKTNKEQENQDTEVQLRTMIFQGRCFGT